LSNALISRTMKAAYGLMIREMRRYFRCPLTVPAVLKSTSGQVVCKAVNISEGGLAIATPSELRNGKEVSAEFTLPGEAIAFTLQCEICWWDGNGRAGLRFLVLPQELRPR